MPPHTSDIDQHVYVYLSIEQCASFFHRARVLLSIEHHHDHQLDNMHILDGSSRCVVMPSTAEQVRLEIAIYRSIYLPIYRSIVLSIDRSFYLAIYLSIPLSNYVYLWNDS